MSDKPAADFATRDATRQIVRLLQRLRRLRRRLVPTTVGPRSGPLAVRSTGMGQNVSGVRAFQPGDDRRLLHARTSARRAAPFVKTFDRDRDQTVMLILDLDQSMATGSGERTKGQTAWLVAACVGLDAALRGQAAGFVIRERHRSHSITLPPRRGIAALVQRLIVVQRMIAAIPPVRVTSPWQRLKKRFTRWLKPEGDRNGDVPNKMSSINLGRWPQAMPVLIASCFGGQSWESLRLGRSPGLVFGVIEPLEVSCPALGLARIADPITGEVRLIDITPEVATEYRERQTVTVAAWQAAYRRKRWQASTIDTGASLVSILRTCLQAR